MYVRKNLEQYYFSKCDLIRNFLRIWLHLQKKFRNRKLHFLCSVSKCTVHISSRDHYWEFSSTQTLTYHKRDSKLIRTWYHELDLNSYNLCATSQALGFAEVFIMYFYTLWGAWKKCNQLLKEKESQVILQIYILI